MANASYIPLNRPNLHEHKTKRGVRHPLPLLLLRLAFNKDTSWSRKLLDTNKLHKIKKIRVNGVTVAFLGKTRWTCIQHPSQILEQITGLDALIINPSNTSHIHVYSHNNSLAYHETDETVRYPNPRRHGHRTYIEPRSTRALISLIKDIEENTETYTDRRSAIPDGYMVVAYDPKIISCEVRRGSLRVELAEGKKNTTMREFRESGLPLGLVYQNEHLEHVVVQSSSVQHTFFTPAIEDAVKSLLSLYADGGSDHSGSFDHDI